MSPPRMQPGSLVLLGTAPAPKDLETLARPPPESSSQGDTGKFITPPNRTSSHCHQRGDTSPSIAPSVRPGGTGAAGVMAWGSLRPMNGQRGFREGRGHPCPCKVLCYLLPAAAKPFCKSPKYLPAPSKHPSKVPAAACTRVRSMLVGSAQCPVLGASWDSPPPARGDSSITSACPGSARAVLQGPRWGPQVGDDVPLSPGTAAGPALPSQPPLLSHLPAGCHLHVPIPALHPSSAVIPSSCLPTRDKGSLPFTARLGVATQGGGCWVLWVPRMGTQPLPPPTLGPRSLLHTLLAPAPSLTPCSASPRLEPEGSRPGVPVSGGVPHWLGDIGRGNRQAGERSRILGTGETQRQARLEGARVSMTEVEPVLDFASSGRTGRRNALPDILGSPAGVSPSDLPLKLAEMSLNAGSAQEMQSPSAEVPPPQPPSPELKDTS
ncbi:uncharacterized protein ACIBXB_002099 [Morphnus guianensis]